MSGISTDVISGPVGESARTSIVPPDPRELMLMLIAPIVARS